MTFISNLLAILLLNASVVFAQNKMIVLGTAQDGGYPQMGCSRACCINANQQDSLRQMVVSLALADLQQKKWWLFEATPDIKDQLKLFAEATDHQFNFLPDGIFITHAHIGHYTGLMQLGREVINSQQLPVYVLPKLKGFLEQNGPWSQLVNLKNISLVMLTEEIPHPLSDNLSVTAFRVPHRDEFSETAGFKITTPTTRYLFIPDIDKWSKWNKDIVKEVKSVDVAYLDATFFTADELPNRKISEVPHPTVTETMNLFVNESIETKNKIHFIHFNHTNPVLYNINSQLKLKQAGFRWATQVKSGR
ncbi:MAG: MBL fold metallo-hydrolase [Cyclobacteriaceae bacterium]|nr:MBL fold metallo-hydrolase [Cyclobacteriaceae bacterium]